MFAPLRMMIPGLLRGRGWLVEGSVSLMAMPGRRWPTEPLQREGMVCEFSSEGGSGRLRLVAGAVSVRP